MSRFPASIMTAISLSLGTALLVMGLMSGPLSQERYRAFLVLTLYGGFLAVLGPEMMLSRRADNDYRQVFSCLFGPLGIGLAMLGVFFSVVWVALSPRSYGIFLAVLLIPYGLALIVAGISHRFLAQRAWRPFLYDLFRQLPYIYWRCRV